jgi:hypothetical protein
MKTVYEDIKRIIRSIRIDPRLWNAFRIACKEDGTKMSHALEGLIRTFLLNRTIAMASRKST